MPIIQSHMPARSEFSKCIFYEFSVCGNLPAPLGVRGGGLNFRLLCGCEGARRGGGAGAGAVRPVAVTSVKTLQCGSDHSICIQFVAKFLLWGNRLNNTNGDTGGRNYDYAAPCQLVDI